MHVKMVKRTCWSLTWASWLFVPDWPDYVRKQKTIWKRENFPWQKCLVVIRGQTIIARGISNSENAEEHLWTQHRRAYSLQQKTTPDSSPGGWNRKWRQLFTPAHKKKFVWSDEFHFLLQYLAVGSKFGIKNRKAWIHPAFYQQFRLLLLV